jgi:hypothetical protein
LIGLLPFCCSARNPQIYLFFQKEDSCGSALGIGEKEASIGIKHDGALSHLFGIQLWSFKKHFLQDLELHWSLPGALSNFFAIECSKAFGILTFKFLR